MAIRLSPEAWFQIEAEYRAGSTAKQLAKRYGVSPSAIHHRSSVERWRDTPRTAAKPTQSERLERVAARLENVARVLLAGRKK
ncbi:hypothetical protein [Caballeronia sp. dw_19]|uniref:hypothetical protein n=1 Tax=Caballeronia sp. dw_19 TaxID=2719791 RepID=UPI001BD6C4C8|nr:hypothetical protein [Caballeronia sp. dw_19]